MQFVVEGDDVVERLVGLVLEPLALAGDVGNLVSRKGRSLSERSSVYHVGDIIRFVQQDASREVFSVHHGRIIARLVGSSVEPCHALLEGHSLGDREGPVHGVQLRVSVHSAVVTDIPPRKETNVCGEVPFLLLL